MRRSGSARSSVAADLGLSSLHAAPTACDCSRRTGAAGVMPAARRVEDEADGGADDGEVEQHLGRDDTARAGSVLGVMSPKPTVEKTEIVK